MTPVVQQAGEPTDEQIDKIFEAHYYRGGPIAAHESAREFARALLASRPQQPQAETPLTDERIEELALKHEAFGFGRVDARGLTTHGFDPDGLRAFARALLAHPNTGAHPPEAEPKQSRVLYADEPLSEQSYTPLPLSPEAQETKPQIS